MASSADNTKADFTLDAMLMRRDSAEHSFDETERVHLVAQFSTYADAFVAHVPENQAQAFQSVLLARYLTFLPEVDAAITQAIREPLEAALIDLSTESADAGTLDSLFRAADIANEAKDRETWVDNETDMPFITVMRNVLSWARGALMA